MSAIASNGADILADINWRIEPGQHWAVLGPNGSGKTTLLKIACGYLWPTSGRVLRLGEELLDLTELRRSIGWISSGMIAEIPPTDTALETVVSGRLGQLGLKWFPEFGPTDADFADAAAELVRLGCECAHRQAVRCFVARRAPTGAHRPGSHGAAAAARAR